VFKAETSSDPIAYFAVSADDMTIEQLSWFIDDTVAKRLLALPGMAEVARSGGVNREIAVTLDPMRMKSLGVTANQVNAALRQVNLNAAGGKAEVAGARQSVRVLGNARSAFDLSQTQIALSGGRTVKLADVADVRDSYSEITSIAKFNGKPVVTFSIARAANPTSASMTKRSRNWPSCRRNRATRSASSSCSAAWATPRTNTARRCRRWWKARCWRSSWCSSSCATGARRSFRRSPSRCPRSPRSG
jgi:multidrug efflux pump subunit AcrB